METLRGASGGSLGPALLVQAGAVLSAVGFLVWWSSLPLTPFFGLEYPVLLFDILLLLVLGVGMALRIRPLIWINITYLALTRLAVFAYMLLLAARPEGGTTAVSQVLADLYWLLYMLPLALIIMGLWVQFRLLKPRRNA